MSYINVLDENTINKIAAGEVVEKPMAVIKELIENSIDAGATAITVEIKNGGIDFMRITDNGRGIAGDELALAFERHATSKIKEIDDLLELSSLGFRGEALASIAAVSMVECITKTASQVTGIRYEIEGGNEVSFKEIGCPDGTTFVIRNLFYNTPARRKFLKTPSTEGSYISDLLEKFALSHPETAFKFINNGQMKFQTNGTGKLKNVIYQLYGRDITANLIPVEHEADKASFSGFIGKPVISRGNRALMSFFVNGRYIKSPILFRAVEDAFDGYHMSRKYPFAVISLNIDSHRMDVNVHPSKMEIRFSEADEIYSLVFKAIRESLKNMELIPVAGLDSPAYKPKDKEKPPIVFEQKRSPEPFEIKRMEAIQAREIQAHEAMQTNESVPVRETMPEHDMMIVHDNPTEYKAERQESLFDIESMKTEQLKDYQVIGCVFSTYWIIQYHDEMYIMDQHAAHEKVLYEQFCNHVRIGTIASQHLSPPLVLTLSPIEADLIKEHGKELSDMGFTVEPFGGNEYVVSTIPADLPGIASEDVLMDWLADLTSENNSDAGSSSFSDKLASMSCKAAVKGGRHITAAEADSLVKQLFVLENPFNCPHGRPTMIKMTKHELEKRFGRVL